MFHKGLDKGQITKAAKNLIEQNGVDRFSMRLLAESLGIKTASLYAHVDSIESLLTDVGLLALQEQKEYQLMAIDGKHRDEAVMCLAEASRQYAKEHGEMYRFIMKMPMGKDEALKQAVAVVAEPAMRVLADYALTDVQKMHRQRILRGLMHGFISQEGSGYFSHYPVDAEESYRIAVQCIIDGIHAQEAKNRAEQ